MIFSATMEDEEDRKGRDGDYEIAGEDKKKGGEDRSKNL